MDKAFKKKQGRAQTERMGPTKGLGVRGRRITAYGSSST